MYALIGARIKKAREKKFISQAELGARLGVTATLVLRPLPLIITKRERGKLILRISFAWRQL